jgi:PAS domain S-box-containing protein
MSAPIRRGRRVAGNVVVNEPAPNLERSAPAGASTAADDQFRRLIQSVQAQAVIILDPQGRITAWDSAAEQATGYASDEIIGQHASRLSLPDSAALEDVERGLQVARSAGRYEMQSWRVRRDGTRFWADIVVTPLRNAAGEIQGFAKVMRESSRLRQAEFVMLDSALRLKAIFETAVDGMITITAGGIIETINPAVEKMFGYTASELIGQNIRVLMPEPDRSQHDQYLANYLETGLRRVIGIGREVLGRRRDGSTFFLELAVSETLHGDRRFFTGLLRDVTSRKQAEADLLASNRRLAEREKELEELTAHLEARVAERTAKLSRQAEQLRLLADQLISAEQRERQQLAHLLHEGLQQMLVAAKMQLKAAGRKVPGPEFVELLRQVDAQLSESIEASRSLAVELSPPVLQHGDLVQALDWLTRRLSQKHHCLFSLDVRYSPPDLPESTKVFLFHAVGELALNVVKHAETDAAWVVLDRPPEGNVALSVIDGGRGFNPETLSQIDSGGIGLFNIREHLEALGGRLDIWSCPGQGARFSLIVPSGRAA